MMQSIRFLSLFLLCALFFAQTTHAQNQNIALRFTIQFPGQTLANICGYAANGKEYALVGGSKGLVVVDVTNPDAPLQIVQIPGPDNLWKEIKTYQHYAYITSEGGQGLQIVDLAGLPSVNLMSKFYTGDGSIAGQLDRIHSLHIDETKGFAYLHGSNLFNGGSVVVNLGDPWNPVFAGKFDQLGYVHDGYVDNDTLYGCHIFTGNFSIVNMADKQNPALLGTQPTPTAATHNTWLSTDKKVVFTTDENGSSYLGAYDISDPTDIQLLDKLQARPGTGNIMHNTHIRGDYAITSIYTEGVSIIDVSHPENMVQVGLYDTWPADSGGGFDGYGRVPIFALGQSFGQQHAQHERPSRGIVHIDPNLCASMLLEGRGDRPKHGFSAHQCGLEIHERRPQCRRYHQQFRGIQNRAGQCGRCHGRVLQIGLRDQNAFRQPLHGTNGHLERATDPLGHLFGQNPRCQRYDAPSHADPKRDSQFVFAQCQLFRHDRCLWPSRDTECFGGPIRHCGRQMGLFVPQNAQPNHQRQCHAPLFLGQGLSG